MVKTTLTACGKAFGFELWKAAHGPQGDDFVGACVYHRGLVRLFGVRREPASVVADMLRALGWVQVSRHGWVCPDCAQDPWLLRFDWSTSVPTDG